jgi:PAS domain S-box-containing protein
MENQKINTRDLKVLILEDQESDAVLMAHELRKAGYMVAWRRVDSEPSFVEAINQGDFHVILSDYSLPSFNARRALQLFRATKRDIPFIIVTGSLGEEQAVELMRMGASDYLIKDRLARLGSAVGAALEQKRLRDNNREALQQLRDSEARFRRMVENSPDTLFRFRTFPDERYDYFSPAVERLTGYRPQEFYNDPSFILQVIHPDDADKLKHQFSSDRVILEPYILRWICKDGSVVWTEQRNVPVYNDNGLLVAVEGISRDITQDILRTREREAIITLVSALRDKITRAEILPVLLENALDLSKADGIAITNAGEDDHSTAFEMGIGCLAGLSGVSVVLSDELYQKLVKDQTPVDLTRSDSRVVPLPEVLQKWANGLMCVPLLAQGESSGILWVVCRPGGRLLERTADHLKLLSAIADIAGSALLRARMYEETQHRVQHLTALRTIDRAITASLDLHLTLNVLLDQLMIQQGVDAADVLLVDPITHQLYNAAGRGLADQVAEGARIRIGESIAGQVVMDRKLLNIPIIQDYPRAEHQKKIYLGAGFRAYLGVPLVTKGEVLGVLEILRRSDTAFDSEWMEFVESMASQLAIAIHNGELFGKLQKTNQDIVQAYDVTISSWSAALELREIETKGHMERVIWWTLALGRALNVPESEMIHLRRGAALHDIGKLALPDSILLKPGALTGDELLLMRKHPEYAHDWLSPIPYLRPALDIPYNHHESWDGNGYPRGLKGLEIPLAARIFALVDSWDALRSVKPYRAPWTKDQALQYIHDMTGVRFDPLVAEAFYSLVKQDLPEAGL